MKITGEITVSHKGYTAVFNKYEDGWYGKIRDISDLVTIYAERFGTIKVEGQAAIDDYLETCTEIGVEPNKPSR